METLKTSTLHLIAKGMLAASLDQHLAMAQHDISDRPKVKGPRKITLELILKPADSGEDVVDAVDVQFTVDLKKPKTTMKGRMASFPKTKSFGFETDTNKVTHAPNQRAFAHNEDGSAEEEE
jgi:hypothetical protein